MNPRILLSTIPRRCVWQLLSSVLLLLVIPVGLAHAQEFRATVVGQVTDEKGAPIPGATVGVTNVETGETDKTMTNSEGNYITPFLNPGRYRVTVESPGFKRAVREGIILRVNDRVTIDLQLEVGQVSDAITVIADTPLVDADSGSNGQGMDHQKVTEYPLNGRMVFMLLDLATGVQFTQETFGNTGFSGTRPFDNNGSWSINGGQVNTNEFLLDGAPNSVRGRYNVAPTVDAIREFKVQTSAYDSQYGRTGGGVINMQLKSGTKKFHGSLFEFLRNSVLDANNFQNNLAGAPKGGHQFNNFGVVFDGPVRLPKLSRGDKTFFMFSYEGIRERIPFPVFATVPTLEQRRGDFSKTFNGNTQVVIYDPLTTRTVSGKVVRDPFPGNIIPANRLNPVALNLLKFIPLPNLPGDPESGFNNYFATPNTGAYTYNSYIGRIDHQLNERNKFFGSYVFNHRDELRNSNGLPGVALRGNWQQERTNNALVMDWVSVRSSTTVLNLRASANRFIEIDDKRNGDNFDISQLGFKGIYYTLDQPTYPHLTFEQYTELGPGGKYRRPDNTASLQGTLSKIIGRHSVKFGGEYRYIQSNRIDNGEANGRFDFNRVFTRKDPNNSDAFSGNAIASFLLGYPSGGTVDNNTGRTERWRYYVGFVQDDIKLKRTLTLNLGLRWDYEQPVTEKRNRINRGFDFTSKNPLQDLVDPKYGLDLRGGLLFAGVDGQPEGGYNPDRNTWQPRIGVAWRFANKTVLRGGFGRYFQGTSQLDTQSGFSRATPFISSIDGNFKPALDLNTLEVPYPRGLLAPPGSSEGLATLAGFDVPFDDPNRRIPRTDQFSIGIQRELPGSTLLDVSYVGSRTERLAVTTTGFSGGIAINEITADQLKLGSAVLNKQVPNPFYGVLPLAAPLGRSAMINQRQLMRPYPQFQNLIMGAHSTGHSWYNSLQARLEKRLSRGLTFITAYTYSKNLEQITFLNAQDAEPSRELASYDRTHRLALSGLWELPVGRNRWLFRHANGLVNWIVGGWQFNWIGNFQSGVPTPYPGGAELAAVSPKLPKDEQTFDRWFNTGKASSLQAALDNQVPFYTRPGFTLRRIPLRFPNVRNPYAPQINLSLFKNLKFGERVTGQFRVESFNFTNTPIFPGPNTDITSGNFGKVTRNQINFPRHVQVAMKLRF